MKLGSWASIISLFLYGVLGASTVSKLIPLSDDLARQFSTDPTQFGWLISFIALPAALLAIPSGVLVDRYGSRRVLQVATLLGVMANVIYYFAPSLFFLKAARFVEGAAICHIYTAVPALYMASTEGKRRARAMTLWATYMPIGTAVGLLLASHFAGAADWRNVFVIHGALFVIVGLINQRQPALPMQTAGGPSLAQRLQDLGGTYSRPALLLFALAFFLMISLGFGANSTFPSYFARVHDVPLATSSQALAFATLLMIPGSLGVGALLAGGMRQQTVFLLLGVIGAVVGSLAFYPVLSIPVRTIVVVAWFVVSGASIATLMATLPLVAEPQRRGAAAAMLNMSGAIATFVNPPIWLPLAAIAGVWLPFAGLMVGGWVIAVASVWGLAIFRAREVAK